MASFTFQASRSLLRTVANRVDCCLLIQSKRAASSIPSKYFNELELPKSSGAIATYVWIDGTGFRTRSKTRVFEDVPKHVEEIPSWAYDGSSTGQAKGHQSDMTLKPIFMCPDPFLKKPHVIVLCESYDNKGQPAVTNFRRPALEAYEQAADQEPWFGMEQEYTLLNKHGRPYGWPDNSQLFPGPQGPYYCASGALRAFGRQICEAHLFACLYAGIKNTGTNAEVMPGQWEYQIGPCTGIEVADHLWVARYIMERMAEEYGADVTLDSKPISGDWNGAGNHTNFSTKEMRAPGGMDAIVSAVKDKLAKRHNEHIAVYGQDNVRRLTGAHETAKIDEFKWGVGDRGASVRIPRPVAEKGYGWLEDRRPAASCDPYAVVNRMIRTVCLNE